MKARLNNFLRGLVANLKFSNRYQLIYDRVFRRNAPLVRYVWKSRLFAVCNPTIGDHFSLQECLCDRAYDHLLDQCEFHSNSVSYVNIGANIGAFDLLLLDRKLNLQIGLAVELNPSTYARCLVNFQANQITAVRLLNAGVAGAGGMVQFRPSRNSRTDSIFSSAATANKAAVEIELLTLEMLLGKFPNLPKGLDLLKLDCEGAEYGIIRLSPPEVLRRFRYIIIEFHPEPEGESVAAAYARLQQAGFMSKRGQPGQFLFTDLFVRNNSFAGPGPIQDTPPAER